MSDTEPCSQCGAPSFEGRSRCPICIGFDEVADRLTAEVRGRALTCEGCGAPLVSRVSAGDISCPCCDTTMVARPLDLESLQLDRPDGAPASRADEDAGEASEKARLQSLRSQGGERDAPPYYGLATPGECEDLVALDAQSPETPYRLYAEFHSACQLLRAQDSKRGRGGGAYRQAAGRLDSAPEAERRAQWIAHRALAVFVRRSEPLRARPLLEQAFDLSDDAGWRQLILCDLSGMAQEEGDYQAAERWLEPCDSTPWWLELDSSYRLRRGRQLAADESWEEALALVDDRDGQRPCLPVHQQALALLRIAALESLERETDADEALQRLVTDAGIRSVDRTLSDYDWLSSAGPAYRRHLARLEQEAFSKQQKALLKGLLFGLAGIAAVPISIVVVAGNTVKTLTCERGDAEGGVSLLPMRDGGPSPGDPGLAGAGGSASPLLAAPSCHIVESLLGQPIGEHAFEGLVKAEIETVKGDQGATSSYLTLVSPRGIENFTSCSNCQTELLHHKQAIRAFLHDPSTPPTLTVHGTESDPGAIVGLLIALAGLVALAIGVVRIVRSMGIKTRLVAGSVDE